MSVNPSQAPSPVITSTHTGGSNGDVFQVDTAEAGQSQAVLDMQEAAAANAAKANLMLDANTIEGGEHTEQAEEAADLNATASAEQVQETNPGEEENKLEDFASQFGTALLLADQDIAEVIELLADHAAPGEINQEKVLEELNALVLDGSNLNEVLGDLSDAAKYSLLKGLDANKESLALLAQELQHGSALVEAATKLDINAMKAFAASLQSMSSKPRAELYQANPEEYLEKSKAFKDEIAKAFNAYSEESQQAAIGVPGMQAAMARTGNTPLQKLELRLQAIAKKYDGEIATEDLQKLYGSVDKINEKAQEKPGLLDKYGDWKEMVFSREGFAAMATMLPLLAGTVQGLLSIVGLGKVAAPLTKLAQGAAAMGEKVFHMVYLFGQQQTNRALTAKVEGEQKPPEPKN
ncbi:MAG: hypothetical protein OXU45_05665 [Candidatus Melainabacteria bacterium]|nr:hypothetical protein [Candidatus Melainabacteria bacterium]